MGSTVSQKKNKDMYVTPTIGFPQQQPRMNTLSTSSADLLPVVAKTLSYFLESCLGHTCKDNVITICIAINVTMCGMDITAYSQHASSPARVPRDIRHQSR